MPDEALETLYSEDSLGEIVERASAGAGTLADDLEFAGYQVARMEELLQDVSFNYLTTSFLKPDEDYKATELRCVPWNLPFSIIDSYEKFGEFDATSEPVYKNTGRIVSSHERLSEEEFEKSYFYIHHCKRNNIKRALMIAFPQPTHARTMVTFDYLFAPDNDSWKYVDRSALEFGSFLFALAWLYRKGDMDVHHLRYLYQLMHSMTAGDLLYLRKYINSPHQSLGAQAKDLGVERGVYASRLYALRDELKNRSPWYAHIVEFADGFLPLRALDAEYNFMRMLGDPTKPLMM